MQLHIERLSKTYANGVHALQGVSLVIPRGMFGLLGPNGAGKSTLMRILATLQEADSGSATLGEVDVLRQKEAVRRVLGYLPQEFGLYPKVTAMALLDHFALLKGVGSASERRRTVAALLQQTNLWDARHKKLGGFSGGMRQRFGIAVALIGDPRLIIVDEPTAGLDPAERVRFLNLLSEIGENAVVILSTHIVEDVSELCSRMAIINHGRILLEGEPLATIDRLRGRVWRRIAPRDQLPALEAAHTVISTKLLSGRTVVHVVADARPDASFDPVEPDLEDIYFSTIRGIPLDRLRGAFDPDAAASPPILVPTRAPETAASEDEARPDADPTAADQTSIDPEASPSTSDSLVDLGRSTASADVDGAVASVARLGPGDGSAPVETAVSDDAVDGRLPSDATLDLSTDHAGDPGLSAADTLALPAVGPGPVDSGPVDSGSIDSRLVDARPVDPGPADAVTVDAVSDDAASVDARPSDPAQAFDHDTLPLFPEYGGVPEPRAAADGSGAGEDDAGCGADDAFPDQLGLFDVDAGPAADAR